MDISTHSIFILCLSIVYGHLSYLSDAVENGTYNDVQRVVSSSREDLVGEIYSRLGEHHSSFGNDFDYCTYMKEINYGLQFVGGKKLESMDKRRCVELLESNIFEMKKDEQQHAGRLPLAIEMRMRLELMEQSSEKLQDHLKSGTLIVNRLINVIEQLDNNFVGKDASLESVKSMQQLMNSEKEIPYYENIKILMQENRKISAFLPFTLFHSFERYRATWTEVYNHYLTIMPELVELDPKLAIQPIKEGLEAFNSKFVAETRNKLLRYHMEVKKMFEVKMGNVDFLLGIPTPPKLPSIQRKVIVNAQPLDGNILKSQKNNLLHRHVLPPPLPSLKKGSENIVAENTPLTTELPESQKEKLVHRHVLPPPLPLGSMKEISDTIVEKSPPLTNELLQSQKKKLQHRHVLPPPLPNPLISDNNRGTSAPITAQSLVDKKSSLTPLIPKPHPNMRQVLNDIPEGRTRLKRLVPIPPEAPLPYCKGQSKACHITPELLISQRESLKKTEQNLILKYIAEEPNINFRKIVPSTKEASVQNTCQSQPKVKKIWIYWFAVLCLLFIIFSVAIYYARIYVTTKVLSVAF